MDNRSGIYSITHLASGRQYIGSAISFKNRWKTHRADLRRGNHHSRFLQRAWNKHGAGAFEFKVLLICDKHNLIDYEQRCLDGFKPEYNSDLTAGSRLGSRLTPEQCLARSAQSKKLWADNYEKMRAATAGTSWSVNRTGHSPESKAKISVTKRGVSIAYPATRKSRGPVSAVTRAKISAAQTGVPKPRPTEATRQKLRAAQKARREREQLDGF